MMQATLARSARAGRLSASPALRRGYAQQTTNGAPSERAANTVKSANTTGSPASGGGVSIAGIAVALALGGGAYWYFSSADNQAAANKELHKVENEASHLLDDAKAKASSLAGKAEDKFDQLKVDTRSLGDKVHDFKTSEKNRAGSVVDPALESAIGKGEEAKDAAKGWFGFGSTSKVDEAKKEAEAKKEQLKAEGQSWLNAGSKKAEEVKEDVKDKASELKSEGKSWLSWGSSKASEAKSEVESKADKAAADAKSTANDLSARAASEYEKEKEYLAAKAQEASSATKAKAQEVKEAGASWTSWIFGKTNNAVDTAKDSAYSTIDSAGNKVGQLEKGVTDATYAAKEKANSAAYSAKEGLKSALLTVEEKTEHGAQKAQQETKKL